MALSKRPVCTGDEGFLYELYCEVRAADFAGMGIAQSQLDLILKMQHQAREQSYRFQNPNAAHEIILLDENPIGRMFVSDRGEEFRLVDIALLNEYRNRGFGAKLLGELCDAAQRLNKPVSLNVEKHNPAIRLYERSGFAIVSQDSAYFFMRRLPDGATPEKAE
ncbi:MAG: GNAT family N-acetyltransferase [Acidobacteriota bacterium]